jgi:ribosome-binding factor A
MQPTRIARLQAAILEELSTTIPREIKDPRVPAITLTRIELSQDAGVARVYFTLLGSLGAEPDKARDAEVKACIEGLNSAAGFLRRHLTRALQIRSTPELLFKEDLGLANTLRINELLSQISSEKKSGDE